MKTDIFAHNKLISFFAFFSEIAGILTAAIGAIVLFGWALDIPAIKSVLPGLVTMKVNTALCFILLGFSLWALQTKRIDKVTRIIARISVFAVIVITALTLYEYISNANLGIDEIFFKDSPEAIFTTNPGRMAVSTAIVFIMISVALLLSNSKTKKGLYSSQILSVLGGMISTMSIIGYLYGVKFLYYGAYELTTMALHTSCIFLIACIGAFFMRPNDGLAGLFSNDSAGGILARRMIPIVILIPIIVDWIEIWSETIGLISGELSATFAVMADIIAVTVFVIWVALSINRIDSERRRAEVDRFKILMQQQDINGLQQMLLAPDTLSNKLKLLTDSIVRIFKADFCRIWMIKPGDLCDKECIHARVAEGPHVCRFRDKCLHLLSSSGRYTNINGRHRRVPFDCYKIGKIASDKEHKFLTNDVINDPKVHDHEWARKLGLVSFAGYQLKHPRGETIGVMALFAKHPILLAEDALLDSLGNTTALVMQQALAEDELRNALIKLKETQSELIQSEKMQIMGQLASGVAHEVRNPLGIILQGVEYLESEIANKSDDITEVMSHIKESIGRANSIISLLYNFSRASNLELQRTGVFPILKDALNLIMAKLKYSNIEVIIDKGNNLPEVLVDKNNIEQVFVNLFMNAFQAMQDKGGKLTIRVYGKSLDASSRGVGIKKSDVFRPDEKAVIVEIEDTGVGITEENMKRLFTPFFTTKKRGEGVGLGLVLSQNIITMHRGLIDITSVPDKGTKLTVMLHTAG
ncbi:MAG: ATP-binding protein [Candidatus Omnitrophica bacterium]|nr:ATP-binding protein [Candidatus Omnitrophota bacterium]